jgi:hypothetical protein
VLRRIEQTRLSSASDDEVADFRCSRRRSAGGDDGTTLFRSVRSDEDGGYAANIAASEASNQYSAMRKRPYKVGTALQSRV